MFDQTIYADTLSTTSSRELEDGRSRFAAQDGPMIDLFGPVPVRANLSARQAKALGLMTSGTYGPPGSGSSASDVLQRSLVSRLQAKTSNLGSTLFRLTWKGWVTPSGRRLSRLRASVLRTSATAPTSWPTPTTRDHKDGAECLNVPLNALLGRVAWLASWPTTTVSDSLRTPAQNFATTNITLNHAAVLASWPTPTANQPGGSPEAHVARKLKSMGRARATITDLGMLATLAAWPTPTASLADKGVRSSAGAIMEAMRNKGPDLGAMAALALNCPARLTVFGEILTGSFAGTKSGGQLNPEHSRWLQGYPEAWAISAPNRSDWLAWQDLMLQASSELRPIESEPCTGTETP